MLFTVCSICYIITQLFYYRGKDEKKAKPPAIGKADSKAETKG